jgi:hypothetical protein
MGKYIQLFIHVRVNILSRLSPGRNRERGRYRTEDNRTAEKACGIKKTAKTLEIHAQNPLLLFIRNPNTLAGKARTRNIPFAAQAHTTRRIPPNRGKYATYLALR